MFSPLPTGSGKSLIFQMAPAAIHQLSNKGYDAQEKPILIVICPLNSLIDSHIRELSKRGITASILTSTDNEKSILNGEYSFIFCNPESIVKNHKWREMVSSDIFHLNSLQREDRTFSEYLEVYACSGYS